MKSSTKLIIFLLVLIVSGDRALSLSDYQIKRICKNEFRKSTCIKDLQRKRFDLNKGKYIEIPVIPHKR